MSKSSRPLPVPDRSARHWIRQHRREQMQRGVHAHARIAKVPVDRDMHGLPDFQIEARRNCRRMRDLGLFAIDVGRARDTNGIAVRASQRAGVAGLPARCGVEDGAIENDATGLRQGDHGGAAILEIGVLAEQTIGGHRLLGCVLRSQAFSYGTSTCERRSSQSGTASRFSRRNCGLNSFD